jgi:hypothetical protein
MTITNDPLVDSHRHIIHYKKLGAAGRGKAPWRLAVFQTYIQAPGDPSPLIDGESFWSRDYISMKSPFKRPHRSADSGKTCWYRACWESQGGKQGAWSMARAMIP